MASAPLLASVLPPPDPRTEKPCPLPARLAAASRSIHLLCAAGQLAHMFQMGADFFIIFARIFKIKIFCNRCCYCPEKLSHSKQRIPILFILTPSVCLQQHFPQFCFKMPFEMLAEFAGIV